MGHEDVGWVLLAVLGPVPQQGDFVFVLDDVHLINGRPHRALHLWDLVVVRIGLRVKERFKIMHKVNKLNLKCETTLSNTDTVL